MLGKELSPDKAGPVWSALHIFNNIYIKNEKDIYIYIVYGVIYIYIYIYIYIWYLLCIISVMGYIFWSIRRSTNTHTHTPQWTRCSEGRFTITLLTVSSINSKSQTTCSTNIYKLSCLPCYVSPTLTQTIKCTAWLEVWGNSDTSRRLGGGVSVVSWLPLVHVIHINMVGGVC